MSSSVDLRVVFGVKMKLSEQPWWDTEECDGDHEEWWFDNTGFTPKFCPYDANGEYLDGITGDDPRVDAYWDERRAWTALHPIPFDIEYNGSYESDEVFVCAPSCNRYYSATELVQVAAEAQFSTEVATAFQEFLDNHYPNRTDAPKWWLVPFYG